METSWSAKMSVKQKLILNSIFASLPRVLAWSLTLFITPYIVHQLGIALFGTWALLSSLSSYLFLLDFGFATAIARFIAEADATQNRNGLSKIFSISLVLYACWGVAIAFVLLFWQNDICNFLRLEAPDASVLKVAYIATVFGFLFSMLATAYLQMIDGLQKMNVSGTITSVSIISTNIFNIVALYLGYGIVGLAVGSALIQAMTLVAALIAVHKNIPDLKFSRFEFPLFKSMLKYGAQLQVSSLLYIVVIRTESPIISSILGSSAVGYYRLANSLAGLSRDIPSLLLSALIPTATMLHAGERREELQRLYERANTYLAFFAFSVAAFFFCFSESLLRLWLNSEDYLASALPMRLMIIGFCANILTGVCTSIARAMGQTRQEMIINLTIVLLHLSLNIGLLHWIGLNGIGVATAAVLTPMSILLMTRLSAQFGFSLLKISKYIFLPNILVVSISSIIALGVYEIAQSMIQKHISGIRQSELIALLIAGVTFSLSQLFWGMRFGIVRIEDLQSLIRRNAS
jgi:O-antigen/teichoic acid export membrane protein